VLPLQAASALLLLLLLLLLRTLLLLFLLAGCQHVKCQLVLLLQGLV
jgi:hypothetical protein